MDSSTLVACFLEKIHDANFSISSSFRGLGNVVLVNVPDPFLAVPAYRCMASSDEIHSQ